MKEIELTSGQTISLGSEVLLRALRVRHGSVQLGIEAPQEVHIVRSELELRPKEHLTQHNNRRAQVK
ncbi:hypothetical protein EY04_27950 [Pseudomonas chlororaphis]|uniref:carbon storage regulator n=1 Tax=Pseudomonas chlororaphis TaxID=587753 RepID=UPI0004AC0867|nr:hypothetical protein EY04_27950 [Pseudomonas chlororaphis]